ncbi:hypothetical protein J6590_046366 [Homalodisca vitripennis]|nr:hypothetical protein J6590_046366 [Homalodisca vitripennis]
MNNSITRSFYTRLSLNPSKRWLLISVTYSVLLYGCELWVHALSQVCYRQKMAAVQRKEALWIASAYRTVSSKPAVLMVAVAIPTDLLAEALIYKKGIVW